MNLLSITGMAQRFAAITWNGLGSRQQFLPELASQTLLHAGPPLQGVVPTAIRHSAAQALCYEGMADSVAQGLALLDSGRITLAPAQDYGVVTPLAQVVSANMPMAQLQGASQTRWAPLIEAGVPALRFGNGPADSVARLRLMALFAQQVLVPALARKPVAIAPLVQASLERGEECHAFTGVANTNLVQALDLAPAHQQVLLAYPAFALPILMASCSVYLDESGAGIVAAAGNGLQFGLRYRGDAHWRVVAASAPQGIALAGCEGLQALGAIGDSAVVDFAGLGGQALGFCPALAQSYAHCTPADLQAHRLAVLDTATGNVAAHAVQAAQQSPLVNLAILGQAQGGLIGRGVYAVPLAAFV